MSTFQLNDASVPHQSAQPRWHRLEHVPADEPEPAPLLVLECDKDRPPGWPAERCVNAASYLSAEALHYPAGTRVINLCRGYKYLSPGYYCSLLAEARGHQVFPSAKTINDLSSKAIYQLDLGELEHTLQAALAQCAKLAVPARMSVDVFLGQADYAPLAALARRVFAAFPAPMLRVEIELADRWHIRAVRTLSPASLEPSHLARLDDALQDFEAAGWPDDAPRQRPCHVAILHDPQEALAPSNPAALARFVRAGQELGIDVTLIEKKDFAQLEKYDALLIRETTAIRHHTYRFAKQAARAGMAVIDDPTSILRCTNKIYLADLLRLHDVPTPRTYVLQRGESDDIARLEQEIGYPMVMKVPDGAFSRGVSKVADRGQFLAGAAELWRHSSLLLVQEYMPTEFDWRIGVLNRRPIFACQYFMTQGHWQVAKRDASGKSEFGMGRGVALDAVPPELLRCALEAANLIGDSLYGVDMKMTVRGPVVIEVNDNPNIDAGIEDGVQGDELYRIVLRELARRVSAGG